MQQPTAELNQRVLGALLALGAGALTLAWVQWPRAGAQPLPAGFPPGGPAAASDAALLAGAGAAAATALLYLLVRPLGRTGAFAAAAGGALAAGLPLLCEPWCGSGSAVWLGPAAALLATAALPLLRERGLLSLCLVPVLVVGPAAWARHASNCEATAAAPLRELQGKAPVEGPIGLELEAEDAALAPVLVAALRRPCFAVDLDVWPVGHGTPEAEWLLRSGTPLLRLHGGGADLQQPSARTTLRAPGRLRVEPAFLESRPAAVEGIRIHAGDLAVRGTWAVYTPWGCRSGSLDETGSGTLDATAWKQLVQQGPVPHTGDRIRVLAVSREEQPVYGWADLCLP